MSFTAVAAEDHTAAVAQAHTAAANAATAAAAPVAVREVPAIAVPAANGVSNSSSSNNSSGANAASASSNGQQPQFSSAAPRVHRPIPQLLHLQGTKKRLIIGLVGLPARGKTYVGQKLCRYLNWIGYRCATFSVGSYRRKAVGPAAPPAFFAPDNAAGVAQREELARQALGDLFTFLGSGGGQAAIYDGTNSTVARRRMVAAYVAEQERLLDIQVQIVWLEMVSTDASLVADNIREAKLTSPDAAGLSAEEAQAFFAARIAQYEKCYEPLGFDKAEDDLSYLVNYDTGRRVIHNKIQGFLMSKIGTIGFCTDAQPELFGGEESRPRGPQISCSYLCVLVCCCLSKLLPILLLFPYPVVVSSFLCEQSESEPFPDLHHSPRRIPAQRERFDRR